VVLSAYLAYGCWRLPTNSVGKDQLIFSMKIWSLPAASAPKPSFMQIGQPHKPVSEAALLGSLHPMAARKAQG
jgi:hypothetical protein